MGTSIVDSCKSTVRCCDSDDERGYKGKIYKATTTFKDNDDNEEDELSDNEGKKNQQLDDIINKKVISIFRQRHQNPWNFYEQLEELGVGYYGVVHKVRLIKNPDIIRAMKTIPEENVVQGKGASLIDEIEILKELKHPNIMKVYESFVDNHNYYIVSELCDQGHLLGKMEKLGKMDQIVVKYLMEQILNAVAYLHSKNVLHGDIKLENILLSKLSKRGGRRFTSINEVLNKDESIRDDINRNYRSNKTSIKSKNYIKDMMNYEIKLIDFGCSKYFIKKKKRKRLSGIIGTSIYCSPEVVDNLYDERCDEWSCGVLMYILLSGIPPFSGDTEEEIFEKIKKCEYDFSPLPFKNVSKNCKDLIRKLLEPNKHYRIKADEALRHPFFTESFDPSLAMTEDKDLNILKHFINPINYQSKFHEKIIAVLCVDFLPAEEENKLKAVFRYMDKNNKGIITKEIMKECLEEINLQVSDEDLTKIFDNLDENSSGYIEYEEFIRNVCNIENLINESNLKNVFHSITGDKDIMTGEDIKKFIFHDLKVQEKALREFFEQFGMQIEDKINFNQFYYMIKNNAKLQKDDVNKKKLKESKYTFIGNVIDEEKGEEEQKENELDNVENGGTMENDEKKDNGEIKENGIKKEIK